MDIPTCPAWKLRPRYIDAPTCDFVRAYAQDRVEAGQDPHPTTGERRSGSTACSTEAPRMPGAGPFANRRSLQNPCVTRKTHPLLSCVDQTWPRMTDRK